MAQLFKLNVSAVILNTEGEVLIQRRALNEEVFPGLWGIPGGTVESTDTSLAEALKREIKEEVDVEIESIEFFRENIVLKDTHATLYLVFISKHLSGSPKALDGTADVLWLDMKNINDYDFTPATKAIILEAVKN